LFELAMISTPRLPDRRKIPVPEKPPLRSQVDEVQEQRQKRPRSWCPPGRKHRRNEPPELSPIPVEASPPQADENGLQDLVHLGLGKRQDPPVEITERLFVELETGGEPVELGHLF
jgi:hypothetical protein